MRFQMSSMARMSPFDGTLKTRIRRRDLRVLERAPSDRARQPWTHNRARHTGCSRHGGRAGL